MTTLVLHPNTHVPSRNDGPGNTARDSLTESSFNRDLGQEAVETSVLTTSRGPKDFERVAEQRELSRSQHDRELDTFSPQSGLGKLSVEERRTLARTLDDIQRNSTLSPDQTKAVLNSLVEDLRHPERINQGMMATCVPTTVQHQLATSDPVHYAGMIRDLATKGELQFKDPQNTTIALNRDALKRDEQHVPEPYEERSITERMFQDVCMRYAVGPSIRYDNATDTSQGTYQGCEVQFKGLTKDQIERLIGGVSGKECARIDMRSTAQLPQVQTEILSQIQNHGGAFVEIKNSASGDHQLHQMVVKEIRDGRVTLYNPHGATGEPPQPGAMQSMSLNEFAEKLSCVYCRTTQPNRGVVNEPPPIQRVTESYQVAVPEWTPEQPIRFHIDPSYTSPHMPTLQIVKPFASTATAMKLFTGDAEMEPVGTNSTSSIIEAFIPRVDPAHVDGKRFQEKGPDGFRWQAKQPKGFGIKNPLLDDDVIL